MAHPLVAEPGIDYSYLVGELKLDKTFKEDSREILDYYNEDHWRNMKGYLGPLPGSEDEHRAEIIANIKRGFVWRNVVKEGTTRTHDGLVGKEPNWYAEEITRTKTKRQRDQQQLAELETRRTQVEESTKKISEEMQARNAARQSGNPPSPQPAPEPAPINPPVPDDDNADGDKKTEPPAPDDLNTPLIDEAEEILTEFWERPEATQEFKKCVLHWLLTGRAGMRMYIPSRLMDDEGNVKAPEDFFDAAKQIRFEYIQAEKLRILDDEGEKISVVNYERESLKKEKTAYIEFSFVDDERQTFVGTIAQNPKPKKPLDPTATATPSSAAGAATNSAASASTAPANAAQKTDTANKLGGNTLLDKADMSSGMRLNGNLTAYELAGEPFVNKALLKNNALLNLALTMLGSVLVEGGFPELATLNAAIAMEDYAEPSTGEIKQRPAKMRRGPGAVQNIVGIKTMDDEGNENYTSPGINYKEPSPVTTFKDGKEIAYQNCLEEMHQLFVLISGDATASGESRIQARGDFLKRLLKYKPEIDRFGSWFLSTVLYLVAEICGKSGYFEKIAVKYDSKLFVGELTADEKRVILEQFRDKIISKETAMIFLGVDNVEAEKQLLAIEAEENLLSSVKRMQVLPPTPFEQQNGQNGNKPGDKSGNQSPFAK